MEITIRRVRPDEMGLLCELDVRIFGSDCFDSPEDWEGLEIFFITTDEQIIGSLALRHNTDVAKRYYDDYTECVGHLYGVSLGILPDWQDKGIGTQAMRWMIDYGRKHGFTRIVANARASNIQSIRVQQKAGFEIVRIYSDWYDEPTENSVVLGRDI